MEKLNLTSFGLPKNLSHYLRLKITLVVIEDILVVSIAKEFVVVDLVMLVKP